MKTAATRTMLQEASTRPVNDEPGTLEIGLTSKERRVVAIEKIINTKARIKDGSVTKTSGLFHGVQSTVGSLRSHVLIVSGLSVVLGTQLRGKSSHRSIVIKKVVT